MKNCLIFAIIFLLVSCSITKRRYQPGWYIDKKSHLELTKIPSENWNDQISCSEFDLFHKRNISFSSVSLPVEMKNFDSTIGLNEISTIKVSFMDTFIVKEIPDMKIRAEKQIQSNLNHQKQTITPFHKITKGWKIFWLTLLIIVLMGAFIVCGALWPQAYYVFFGLSSLIVIFGFSTGAPMGSFRERLPIVIFFIALTLFYYWISLEFTIMWLAILLQLAIYAPITILAILINLIIKGKIKKMNKH